MQLVDPFVEGISIQPKRLMDTGSDNDTNNKKTKLAQIYIYSIPFFNKYIKSKNKKVVEVMNTLIFFKKNVY